MKDRKFKLTEGHILKIWQDQYDESPDSWGNEDMFLVYEHRNFTVTRTGFAPHSIHNYLVLSSKADSIDLRNDEYDNYWIFVVYAYVHSGVSLSLRNYEYPFNSRWDTSTTGFVLVEKERYIEGKKPTIVTKPEAKKYAQGLIDTWNIYLSGEVYGYSIYEETTCKCCGNTEEEQIDSCAGFYKTTDEALLTDILDNMDSRFYPTTPHSSTLEIAKLLLDET